MAEVQSSLPLFERMGVKIIAASTDAQPEAQSFADAQNLTFQIAYGMNSDDITAIGAIPGTRQGEVILQPAEFVLNPEGEVVASMYSSTQLGRMNPREVLQFLKSRMGD